MVVGEAVTLIVVGGDARVMVVAVDSTGACASISIPAPTHHPAALLDRPQPPLPVPPLQLCAGHRHSLLPPGVQDAGKGGRLGKQGPQAGHDCCCLAKWHVLMAACRLPQPPTNQSTPYRTAPPCGHGMGTLSSMTTIPTTATVRCLPVVGWVGLGEDA